jgi:microcystin-dependent protein
MKRIIFSVALWMLILAAVPRPAAAQGANPFVGEVELFAFTFCPSGWAPLDGQILAISSNTPLFSLIGNFYGGDGKTTFGLPKWGPIPTVNGQTLTACISLFGVFPSQN